MVAQVSSQDVVNIFKRVYGNINNLVPDKFPGLQHVPFNEKAKVGDQYVEDVILTNETGITLGGSSGDVFNINPARAGTVKQALISPYVSVLPSVVPWSVLSRSAGGGEKAFIDGTKYFVKNNVKSHMQFAEAFFWYGQADALLGYVSYATATYRGVSFTTGTGTLGGIAFTNGVNTSTKNILLAPGSFASGVWVGMEGVKINQVNSSNVIVASGSLVSIDNANGILNVDFTPVAASSTTSHRLCFDGQEGAKEYVGVNKILSNTGSLFSISAATYSLWKGSTTALSAVLLTFDRLQTAAANCVNGGGLDGDVDVFVNPRSFAKLVTAEAARRQYDDSFSPEELINGAKKLKFAYSGGDMNIAPCRFIKEGEAYGLESGDSWLRSGSAQISLKVPGIDKELIFPLENSSAYGFRSYSDQYVFCRAPARSFLITGINDEASS